MQGSRNDTHIITWRQFAHKGYAAFASLHRQIRIGVLSVATLSVAAAAQAQTLSNSPSKGSTKEGIPIEEEGVCLLCLNFL